MIQSRDLQFLMEANSGLSAKIVEAGIKGIWASGLSISQAWGCMDQRMEAGQVADFSLYENIHKL